MSDNSIKVLDYIALLDLRAALIRFGEDIESPLRGIDEQLSEMKEKMEEKIDRLREQYERAKERLERAEAALERCLSSQKWDDEDNCYRPSCSNEHARVSSAREECNDALQRYNTAQNLYKEIMHEVEEYQKPFGVVVPGGAADYLRKRGEVSKTDAKTKMDRIVDTIEKYLGAKARPDRQDLSKEEVRKQLVKDAEEKADKFQIAKRSVEVRNQETEVLGAYALDIRDPKKREETLEKIRRGDYGAICPLHGIAFKLCPCGREAMERYRFMQMIENSR